MTSMSVVRAALFGAGLVGAAVAAPAPAHAQYYGYGYGYYGYRPYYVPFYRPRVLFAPPPVYVTPMRPLIVTVPRPVVRRRMSVARAVAPAPAVCAVPGESPFAGSGVDGVVPASASQPAPFVAPVPGMARARPGVGDLPSGAPGGAPAAVAPSATAAPPRDVAAPESGFRGD